MTDLLQMPLARPLAWALVHFLWQGAAIGIAAALVLRFARLSPASRYLFGTFALMAMLAAPIVTCVWLLDSSVSGSSSALILASGNETSVVRAPSPSTAFLPAPAVAMPVPSGARNSSGLVWLLAAWLTGVTGLSIRLLGGVMMTRQLVRRGARPAVSEVQELARRVASRLALQRFVVVLESPAVALPMLVGWIKPAVLLPIAVLSFLTPAQLEALLAHELAHVRRHDYLINLLQAVVETLLFYHPAVWWVSRQVRTEREYCCDDLAVGVCDKLIYATALADLATMSTPRLALAATDGPLIARIRRILGQSQDGRHRGAAWLPAMTLVLLVGGFMPTAFFLSAGAAEPPIKRMTDDAVLRVLARSDIPLSRERVTSPSSGTKRATNAQADRARVEKADMLAQLLERARQYVDNVKVKVQIGTMSTSAMAEAESTLKRLQIEADAQQKVSGSDRALSETEAGLMKRRFVEAMQRLDAAEKRFDVGLGSVQTIDEALSSVLAVLAAKTTPSGTESGAASAPQELAAQRGAQQVELQRQLESLRQELKVAQARADVGDATADKVRELQAQMKALEQRLVELKINQAASQKGDPELSMALMKIDLEASQSDVERLRRMYNVGLVSSQDLARAELDLKKQMVMLQRMREEQQAVEARKEADGPAKVTWLMRPASPEGAALFDRAQRERAMTDTDLVAMLRDVERVGDENDRAAVLMAVAMRQTMTPEVVTAYVRAIRTIKSEELRAKIFAQPVRLR